MEKVSRRHFLNTGAAFFCGVATANAWPFGTGDKQKGLSSGPDDVRGQIFKGDAPEEPGPFSREGLYYTKVLGDKTACGICPHRCVLSPGDRSVCRSRVNIGGKLYTLAYGNPCAANVDPIEKKPLFHLLPGTLSYSIATVGCNFKCDFCQNADISQLPADRGDVILGTPTTPRQVVEAALGSGCVSIAYTYTEPTIAFEFAYDTAKRAHDHGLKNIFVTNGYMTREALERIHPFLDAANVDLKAFSDAFYQKRCGARLAPVQETLIHMKSLNIFIEITTLLIPGLNDAAEELKAMAAFLCGSLGPETPWHLSRFHPTYRLTDRPVTPVRTLQEARRIGRDAGLKHVYLGNVPGEEGESTFCPGCNRRLIERWGFTVKKNLLKAGRCLHCGTRVDGIWES